MKKEQTTDPQNSTRHFNALGEQPVGRLLWQYALPAIVAMAASSVYNIIDGIFIGQGVGPFAIMGLALVSPFMALTAAFGAMVGVGASTLMSVRLGQRDYSTAKQIVGNVILMNIILGIGLTAILLLFLDPVLVFFGASPQTLPFARDFMVIILSGNVVTQLYLGFNALLRSTNRPKKAMYATFGTVIINCILAPIFIFVLHWGIRGAATATVSAQLIMLVWQIKLFSNQEDFIHIERKGLRLKGKIVRESLLIGLPPFLINLCACVVSAVVTRSMAHFGGDISVGAYGIANRLTMFVVFVVIGLNQGMQPIAGYNFGARKFDRLMRVLRLALIAGTCITTTGFLIAMFFATPCVTLFAKDSPGLVKEAARGLRIMVMVFPFVGMQIVSTAFFQSIGYAGKSIFLSLTRQLIFLIPLLVTMPYFFSNPVIGVWYAQPISDALASLLAIGMLIWQVNKFKKKAQQIEQ